MRNTMTHSVQLKNGIWPLSFPLWMAAFYVALFIIRPWEILMPWLGTIHFERIYAICMILVVLCSRKKWFHLTSQSVAILMFLGGITLSFLFAINQVLSWDSYYTYLTVIIFFFILSAVICNPYDLAFMVTCYIVTMAVYLAKCQWEYFFHGAGEFRMGVWRLTGIETSFGDPNSLASSIVLSLPFLLFLWSVRKEFSFSWPPFYKRLFPLFLVGYFILALSSIILTASRSGMVGLVLFVVLVSFSSGTDILKKLKYILIGILLLLMLWVITPLKLQNRFQTIWKPEAGPATAQTSAHGRIAGLNAGITMFERFPITGVGIGNFIEYRVLHVDGIPLQAHNLYGQVLGETGFMGFSTFFLMVFVIFLTIRKVRVITRNRSDPTLDILSRLTLACRDSLILLFFAGLFGHNLLRFNWLWTAAFCSLALVFTKQHIEDLKAERISR